MAATRAGIIVGRAARVGARPGRITERRAIIEACATSIAERSEKASRRFGFSTTWPALLVRRAASEIGFANVSAGTFAMIVTIGKRVATVIAALKSAAHFAACRNRE